MKPCRTVIIFAVVALAAAIGAADEAAAQPAADPSQPSPQKADAPAEQATPSPTEAEPAAEDPIAKQLAEDLAEFRRLRLLPMSESPLTKYLPPGKEGGGFWPSIPIEKLTLVEMFVLAEARIALSCWNDQRNAYYLQYDVESLALWAVIRREPRRVFELALAVAGDRSVHIGWRRLLFEACAQEFDGHLPDDMIVPRIEALCRKVATAAREHPIAWFAAKWCLSERAYRRSVAAYSRRREFLVGWSDGTRGLNERLRDCWKAGFKNPHEKEIAVAVDLALRKQEGENAPGLTASLPARMSHDDEVRRKTVQAVLTAAEAEDKPTPTKFKAVYLLLGGMEKPDAELQARLEALRPKVYPATAPSPMTE